MNTSKEQLLKFNQQVLPHPQLASSYATSGFLTALSDLSEEAHDNTNTLKDIIRAFTIVLPPVFMTISKNETETQMWKATEKLLSLLRTSWVDHQNAGVRIYAFKCIQLLVLLESKKEKKDDDVKDTFSLNFIRPGHRLMNVAQLEKEGRDLVDSMLDRLRDENETAAVVTAIISCLTHLTRRRPQFTRDVIGALVTWSKRKPERLSPIDIRSIEKSIKLAFITMIRTSRLSSYRSELVGAFTSVGGNPAALRSLRNGQERHEETKRKRTHLPEGGSGGGGKKAKIADHVSTESAAPSRQFMGEHLDVSSLPLNVVTDLCIAILQNVSLATLTERFSMLPESMFHKMGIQQQQLQQQQQKQQQQQQPQQQQQQQRHYHEYDQQTSIPSPTSPTFRLPHTEVSQSPKQEPMLPSKMEIESKADIRLTPVRPPLASVEERANQSFKMQPYNLAEPEPISQNQQLELLKMSMQRILEADAFVNQSNNLSALKRLPFQSVASSIPQSLSHNSNTKMFWATLVSKVFTLSTDLDISRRIEVLSDHLMDKPRPSELDVSTSISDQMKELLLDFIIEDFPNRYDLALSWLHEERHYDMQYSRHNKLIESISSSSSSPSSSPSSSAATTRRHTYFDWLMFIVERGIVAIDPKDKTLTKVLLAAPALDEMIIKKIQSVMLEQSTRFVMCIATLRDLATQRPTVRSQCLSILLNLCTDTNVKTRSTAIAAVKRWVPLHPVAHHVERYAIDSVQQLLKKPPPAVLEKPSDGQIPSVPSSTADGNEVVVKKEEEEDETAKDDLTKPSSEEQDVSWSEEDVVRHVDLFYALCAKKHELLEELFPVYVQVDQQVQRYIRKQIYTLITSMSISSEKLVQMIKEYQPGCETLILRILKILCDTAPITPDLRVLVKDIYTRKGLRAKFMVPIFTNQIKV